MRLTATLLTNVYMMACGTSGTELVQTWPLVG